MKPLRCGHAEVNGIQLYHEIYGEGDPLVLIHGGLTTIGEMQPWVQPLAKARQVIAVEMPGHGHMADIDRPMSFVTMGDDLAMLLDHLGIGQADLVGHSFGAACAIRAAIQHPKKRKCGGWPSCPATVITTSSRHRRYRRSSTSSSPRRSRIRRRDEPPRRWRPMAGLMMSR